MEATLWGVCGFSLMASGGGGEGSAQGPLKMEPKRESPALGWDPKAAVLG